MGSEAVGQELSSGQISATRGGLSGAAMWLLLAAALPAVGALHGPFFLADDGTMITKNPYVTGERDLAQSFVKPYFSHYAPLHIVLIKLQHVVFGPSALGFRLVSILLQFFAAAACWKMLTVLSGRRMLAFGVAALWAAHPIQSESVAWVVEQKTLWSGLFTFLAVAVYADERRAPAARISLALLLMIAGALGKSSAIVVLPLLLLYELLLRGPGAIALPLRLAKLLPFALATGVFAWLALWAHGHMEDLAAGKWNKFDTVLNAPGALLLYLRAAFLPWTASYFQEMNRVTSAADPAFFLKLFVLAAIAVAVVAMVKPSQRRLMLFCTLAWVAGIGPMLNLSPWTFPAYDRYLYMGLPFLLLGMALVAENIIERLAEAARPNARKIAWGGALALSGTLGLSRGMLFSSELAVVQDAVEKAPKNAYSHAALAHTLYPEYLRAREEGRREDQLRLADAIGREAELANACWNFRDFFHSPVSLLSISGNVLLECEMYPRAEALLEAAFADPRWASFYKAPTDGARRGLVRTKLQIAERLLMARVEIDKVEPLIQLALRKIEESRALAPPEDESYLLEATAWEALARLNRVRKEEEAATEHLIRARAALDKLPVSSRLNEAAQKLREIVGP